MPPPAPAGYHRSAGANTTGARHAEETEVQQARQGWQVLKPEYLRMIAGNAKVCASDFANGGVFRFDDASRLWTVIAELAEECASLSERIAVQENRRVGRPPKEK